MKLLILCYFTSISEKNKHVIARVVFVQTQSEKYLKDLFQLYFINKIIFLQFIDQMFSNRSNVIIGNEFQIDQSKKLGKGATGEVYLGIQIRTGRPIAAKVVNLRQVKGQVYQYLHRMEIAALQRINSPYVQKCYRIIEDQHLCSIITQVCNGGTLKDIIQKQKRLSQQATLQIVLGILIGLSQTLNKGVLHRDLKTENIMMNNGMPKIIDFGYSQVQGFQKPRESYNVGSPCYMAPQSFFNNHYDQKTQIWSIGAILYQCFTGVMLHSDHLLMQEAFSDMQKQGIRLPSGLSEQTKHLVSRCLSFDPNVRPTCSQCIQIITNIKNNAKNSLKKKANQKLRHSTPSSIKGAIIQKNTQSSRQSSIPRDFSIALQSPKHQLFPIFKVKSEQQAPKIIKQSSSKIVDLQPKKFVNLRQRVSSHFTQYQSNRYSQNQRFQQQQFHQKINIKPQHQLFSKQQLQPNFNQNIPLSPHMFQTNNQNLGFNRPANINNVFVQQIKHTQSDKNKQNIGYSEFTISGELPKSISHEHPNPRIVYMDYRKSQRI